jgi:hypothetical protein
MVQLFPLTCWLPISSIQINMLFAAMYVLETLSQGACNDRQKIVIQRD